MQKIIRTAALVVTIALTGLMGCVSVSSNHSNVPANRLIDGRYVSPDARFTLKVPRLVQPGMRVEERRLGPDTFGIFFADDFGTIYYLITTDNREHRFTMEQLAEEYSAKGSLIESMLIDTARGRELRLAGVNEGGSPMVTRSTVDGKTVEQHNNQVEAWSLFINGDEIYQLTAAIVPSSFKIGYQMYGLYVLYRPSSDDSGGPAVSARETADGSIDDFALGQVKMNLETFLAGLTIAER